MNDECKNEEKDQSIENDEQGADKQRPNAKYNLSYPDSGINSEGDLTYHYSRERRLENAPDAVKNLYQKDDGKPKRFSLFGPLVADRPRRILFVLIILMCIAIFALNYFGFFDTTHILDGNRIEITAIYYEGNSIVRLRKTRLNDTAYTGAVDIAVTVPVEPHEAPPFVFYHRIDFTMNDIESYSFTVPFDAPELLMVLQNDRNTLQLRVKPE